MELDEQFQVVVHLDVWSRAQVVVQFFGVFFRESKEDPQVEEIMLCCRWCRAVGLKAHALMLLMIVVIQFMTWYGFSRGGSMAVLVSLQ